MKKDRSKINSLEEKHGPGRPRLYDRRTTISLTEGDIAGVEGLRADDESWESCARRLLRAAIDREIGRRGRG